MMTKSVSKRMPSAREVALRVLLAGGDSGARLDAALRESPLDDRERALATEIVSGTVKMRRALEWSVQACLRRQLASLDPPLRWTLLMGAYQLLYLRRLPAYGVVDESVKLMWHAGHAGTAALANAVLRRLSQEQPVPPRPSGGDSVEALALHSSLPDWIAQHLVDRFGYAVAIEIAQGLNGPPRRALRVNTARISSDEAAQGLARAGFVVARGAYSVPECLILSDASGARRSWLKHRIASGEFAVQSEESQLAVHLLAPRPGEMILDVCAGRGTKTAAIAARLNGDGRIYSLDDDETKLKLLRRSLSRARLNSIVTVRCDARHPYPESVPEHVDAALVDAPCSALGIIGRRPESRWRKRPTDPERFARVQSALLEQAAAHVRPGGRLLYVTCSTHSREDEDVVQAFLDAHPEWRPKAIAPAAPQAAVRRIDHALLTVPGIGGSDGFFYALLERRKRNR